MSKFKGWPSAYQKSQTSDYRNRIRTLGIPLPEPIRDLMDYGQHVYEIKTKGWGVARSIDDLAKFGALVEGLKRSGINVSPLWGTSEFRDNALVYRFMFDKFFLGPLIYAAKVKFNGLEIDLDAAALKSPKEGSPINYQPPFARKKTDENAWDPTDIESPAAILINLRYMLEAAVALVNLFRYGEIEPTMAELLFNRKTEAVAPTKELLRERLNAIAADGISMGDYKSLERILGNGEVSAAAVIRPFFSIMSMRNLGSVVKNTSREDEVDHTVDLLNLHARSLAIITFVSHCYYQGVLQSLKTGRLIGPVKSGRATTPSEWQTLWNDGFGDTGTYAGWLAGMAYGNTALFAGLMFNPGFLESTKTGKTFAPRIGELISAMGIDTTKDLSHAFCEAINSPLERVRNAARILLDKGVVINLGLPFADAFPGLIETIKTLDGITFVRNVDFGAVANIWKDVDDS